jgi:hypothetical protein
MPVIAGARHWANTRWVNFIGVNTENHSGFMDWTKAIQMLLKEAWSFMAMIAFLTKKFIPGCFVTALGV